MSDACQPYDEITNDALGEHAAQEMSYRFEPADQPDDVVFAGPCPRCRGQMTYTWPLMVVRQIAGEEAADGLDVTVICRCPAQHAGADTERGCGAYWTLRIPRPQ